MEAGTTFLCLFLPIIACVNAEQVIFQKCCSSLESLNVTSNTCVASPAGGQVFRLPPLLQMNGEFSQTPPTEYGIAAAQTPKCSENRTPYEIEDSTENLTSQEKAQFFIADTGQMMLNNHEDTSIHEYKDYCVDMSSEHPDRYVVKTCVRDPCQAEFCVRKCCDLKSVYSSKNGPPCVNSFDGYEFIPKFYSISLFSASPVQVNASRYDILDDMAPKMCKRKGAYVLDPSSNENDVFYLQGDGNLYVPGKPVSVIHNGDFCLDANTDGVDIAVVCFGESNTHPLGFDRTWVNNIVYPICQLISAIFLLATFLVHVTVPCLLHNLHGKILVGHVVSLFFGFLTLAIIDFGSDSIGEIACKTLGYLNFYFLLAAFFWLNVMCFDIWRTFSETWLQRNTILTEKRDRKRFIKYAVYSTLSPCVINVVALVMDNAKGISPFFVKPGIGEINCSFSTLSAEFAYFLGPIGALLVLNVIFFLLTAFTLIKAHKQTTSALRNQAGGSGVHFKDRFMMYLKLFFVMGISWSLEVVSWLVRGPVYVWYVPDTLNNLQGVFIFLIFVNNKNVIKKTRDRWNDLGKNSSLIRQMAGTIQGLSLRRERESSKSISTHSSVV